MIVCQLQNSQDRSCRVLASHGQDGGLNRPKTLTKTRQDSAKDPGRKSPRAKIDYPTGALALRWL